MWRLLTPCLQIGEPVYQALTQLLTRMPNSKHVSVRRIAHVGGHKFAANVLVYPAGDWYGGLNTADVPTLLRNVLARTVWWARWRGGLGLSVEEQKRLHSAHAAEQSEGMTANQVKKRDRTARPLEIGEPLEIAVNHWTGRAVSLAAAHFVFAHHNTSDQAESFRARVREGCSSARRYG